MHLILFQVFFLAVVSKLRNFVLCRVAHRTVYRFFSKEKLKFLAKSAPCFSEDPGPGLETQALALKESAEDEDEAIQLHRLQLGTRQKPYHLGYSPPATPLAEYEHPWFCVSLSNAFSVKRNYLVFSSVW